jgi:D-proline reductase (dithiol) PrdB
MEETEMTVETWKDRTLARLFTRFPILVERWARSQDLIVKYDTPWAPLSKDLRECRIALVSTAGVHLRSQLPYDMEDKEGDPTFREIPSWIKPEDLMITHNYYDHRDAEQDINIVFPMQRLGELDAAGFIGGIAIRHFSFMGHIIGRHIDTLTDRTGPEVARMLKDDGVDAAFLTPA